MRTFLMTAAILASLVLAGCSSPDFKPTRIPSPAESAVDTSRYPGQRATYVAESLKPDFVPAEYANLILPDGDMHAQYALVSWDSYKYHADNQSLGQYLPANPTELLAFAANYRSEPSVVGRRGICAPSGFVDNRIVMVFVLSLNDGFRLGWWQKNQNGCKYALLVHYDGVTTVTPVTVRAYPNTVAAAAGTK